MKPETLFEAIEVGILSDVPLCIWSTTGIGKSQITKQAVEELGYRIIDLRLATQEVGELIGMPHFEVDTNQTRWGQPEWWPDHDERVVIFLDEFNRARSEVTQAIFQLVTDKKMHTHILPTDTRIIAACNPPEGDYQVNALGSAMMARFLHITLEADVNQWVSNCMEWIHPEALNYVANSPQHLNGSSTKTNEMTYDPAKEILPTPRSWDMAGRILGILLPRAEKAITIEAELKHYTLMRVLLGGVLGANVAGEFVASLEGEWTAPETILTGEKAFNWKDIQSNNRSDLIRLTLMMPLYLHSSKSILKDPDTGKSSPSRKKNLLDFYNNAYEHTPDLARLMYSRTISKPNGPITYLMGQVNTIDTIRDYAESW